MFDLGAGDAAAAIDEDAVAVKDVGLGMPGRRLGDGLQSAGKVVVIGVEPADEVSGGAQEAAIDGVGLAAVALPLPAQMRITAEDFEGVVTGERVLHEVLDLHALLWATLRMASSRNAPLFSDGVTTDKVGSCSAFSPVIAMASRKAIKMVDCNDEYGQGVKPKETTNCAARKASSRQPDRFGRFVLDRRDIHAAKPSARSGLAGVGARLSGGTVCRFLRVHSVAVLLGTVHLADRVRSRCGNFRYNTMQIPTLSVITPSLNSGAFLEDAILSVALQDGVPVEHIVQDSLSGDNTLEISAPASRGALAVGERLRPV